MLKPAYSSGNKVKAAALLDFSGHYSQFGIETKQAMELGREETKNIEVHFFDTKSDLKAADQLLTEVINSGRLTLIFLPGTFFAFIEEKGLSGFRAAGVAFALHAAPAAPIGVVDPHAPLHVFFLGETGHQHIGKLRVHFKVGVAQFDIHVG